MYCSKCGGSVADGAAFCTNCGQAFPVAAAVVRAPAMSAPAAVPSYAAIPRVEYAGFWLRFFAYVIDSVVLGLAVLAVLIPLFFLTGLGALVHKIRPEEDLNDAGLFLIILFFFAAATLSLLVTWLYHALMESSEWQATVGKKVLGLVVTDVAVRRVSFARSTGRHFGKILTNMIPLAIGYIMAGFTEKKQALHDMLAGCLVLRRNN